jgi:5-methylcytosine-specific restriction endonuclease McrA
MNFVTLLLIPCSHRVYGYHVCIQNAGSVSLSNKRHDHAITRTNETPKNRRHIVSCLDAIPKSRPLTHKPRKTEESQKESNRTVAHA